ncbi:MAG: transposase [Chloracidobacterium sp.]|nr:transposase [Chloracidobacterium sp.]
MIWDRSQTHRARVVKNNMATEREISVEWLPPYAPELNPEEYCLRHRAHLLIRTRLQKNGKKREPPEEIRRLIDQARSVPQSFLLIH